jgi:glucans biosynthesis protein C
MRRYDLDWLRVIAFALLIFYHVGMFFVPWRWHIKNNEVYQWLVYPMIFLNQWRLPLLFVISGMGTYFALAKRTGGEFAKERLSRLLLPLIAGMLFIIPPQVYIERLDKGHISGGYFDFWPAEAFIGIYPAGNMSWHHLWFIVYLLIFSLLLIPVFIYLKKNTKSSLLKFFGKIVSNPIGLYFFVLPLFLWESLVEPFFPTTHAFYNDWFNVINYMTLFTYGFLLISVKDVFWKTVTENRYLFMWAGTVFFTTYIFIAFNFEDSILVHFIEAIFKVCNFWSWIMVIFGFGAYYLNRPGNALSYANEAVYPFYILHQTVTVVLGYYFKDWHLALGSKFLMLSVGTFLLTWIIYELLIRRNNLFRPLFGLKKVQEEKKITPAVTVVK